MNRTPFWRLVWKEYRVQRGFWIAMLALVLLVQLIVVLTPEEQIPNRTAALFAAALGLAAFYALSGAVLFATEHETGTYEFQRSLPVSAGRLLAAKLMFGGLSTLAMLAAAWLLALAMSRGRLPEPAIHAQLWGLWGFAAVELLVWGVFFSLRSERPLVAVILAVTFASVIVHLLAGERQVVWDMAPYLSALPYRALVVAVVAAANVWMGLHWLDEPGKAARRRAARRAARVPAAGPVGTAATRSAVLGRLVWQHVRQSSRLLAAFAVMLTLLVAVLVIEPVSRSSQLFQRTPLADVVVFFAALVGYTAAPLMGACVFLADQSGYGFRFLAEHGVRPRMVWLSRHLVWGAAVFLVVAAVVPMFLAFEPTGHVLEILGILAGFVLLAYACGQLCSMYIHSGILAAVFSIALSFGLCAWAGFMHFLKISWAWSVAPLPVAFLLATWLRSPDWLLERSGWRSRVRAILPVVGPMVAILIAVPFARVYQIPKEDPGFDPKEYARPATPEEQSTMALYGEASEQLERFLKKDWKDKLKSEPSAPYPQDRLTALEELWLKENPEPLRLTLEASRRPQADFFPDTLQEAKWPQTVQLAQLVLFSGKQREIEGKLDEALDRYLAALRILGHTRHRAEWPEHADGMEAQVYERLRHWSARPGQTPERIARALREVRAVLAGFPSPCNGIKTRYVLTWRLLHADPDALARLPVGDSTRHLVSMIQWMPWERTRAVRLLNRRTATDLGACRQAEQAVKENGLVVPEFYRSWAPGSPRDFEWTEALIGSDFEGPRVVWSIAQMETRRRAVQLVLALEAWKLQHGGLPEKLDAVIGPYLDRMPNDPYSGEPFRYVPKGLPIKLEWSEWPVMSKQTLKPGTPFLWSAGMRVTLSGTGGDLAARYRVRDEQGGWRPGARFSEYDVWQAGWIIPIPQASAAK